MENRSRSEDHDFGLFENHTKFQCVFKTTQHENNKFFNATIFLMSIGDITFDVLYFCKKFLILNGNILMSFGEKFHCVQIITNITKYNNYQLFESSDEELLVLRWFSK